MIRHRHRVRCVELVACGVALIVLGTGCPSQTPDAETAPDTEPELADPDVEPAEGTPSEDLIPRQVIFGNPDRANPQVSPDGDMLSWLAEHNGVLNVWVAPVDDLDAARPVTSEESRPVFRYFWAYTNDHIIYAQDVGGDENFRLFAVDLERDEEVELTPMDDVQARVAHVSPKHPERVVVSVNDRTPQLHDLYEVDITTGDLELIEENPGFVGYTIDDDYEVRFAQLMRPDGGTRVLRSVDEDGEGDAEDAEEGEGELPAGWELYLDIGPEDSMNTGLTGFDKEGTGVFAWDSRGRDTSALVRLDAETAEEVEELASDDRADGAGVHRHPLDKEPIAVSFNYKRHEWRVLDDAYADDFDRLLELSEGDLGISGTTRDHDTWLVSYTQDDGPVEYYLYDRDAGEAEFLFTNRSELEDKDLAQMHPVVIEARDGLDLVSYLSLPPGHDDAGRPDEPVPMVLLVHGGPWARDAWGYNAQHQLLADRGYAVLSVNFRGSTGFGKEFLNAGNREWAGAMHDDLIDAVEWAVEEEVTTEDEVCIMGGSYGGYATLVGLTFTPDVFACGVDIVGPSSLITLLESVPPYWEPMIEMFKTRVGDHTTEEGREELRARSPLFKVENIERPLLIAQGANDPRVKQEESDQIVEAMQESGIPVSYVLYPDEGHGFAREPNRLSFYAATEAFLSAHLGGEYEPATAEEFADSTMTIPEGLYGIPGFAEVVEELAERRAGADVEGEADEADEG